MNARRQGLPMRGFTLLEVILAVAIAGMVMTAATALLVAAGNAWLLRDERAFLETHASGVAQFLSVRVQNPRAKVQIDNNQTSGQGQRTPQSMPANRSGVNVNDRPANGTMSVSVNRPTTAALTSASGQSTNDADSGIQWRPLPGSSPADEPKLTLPLATGHPLLLSQLPVERGLEAFLAWDAEDGLSIQWSSPLQEEAPRRPDELNRTHLSPWVSVVEYFFMDPRNERWERTTTTPYDAQNNPLTPQFIRLVFSRNDVETERMIAIPPFVNGGIPLY